MNNIRHIQELNRKELENGISPEASWHADYRDTAYIYIGGLPFELSEGDVITIFSQFGEPTFIDLIRDKETGKSRGFAFLKYEDQRSTDLAVDNLGGAVILGKTLRVDHTRYKKKEDASKEPENEVAGEGPVVDEVLSNESEEERPMLKEERDLALLIRDHDDEDPMKAYLIEEKKAEVAAALEKQGRTLDKSHRRHRHHSHKRAEKERSRLSQKESRNHRARSRSEEGRRPRHRSDREQHKRRRSRSRDRSGGRHRGD